jgi:hypothetical protein
MYMGRGGGLLPSSGFEPCKRLDEIMGADAPLNPSGLVLSRYGASQLMLKNEAIQDSQGSLVRITR